MGRFELRSVVVESVDAWVECEECGGKGELTCHNYDDGKKYLFKERCPTCNGKGGEWHEAIVVDEIDTAYTLDKGIVVTKSTILTREHEVCSECEGKGKISHPDYPMTTPYLCNRCLKDADGKPTGAEPNTASPWRVKAE